MSMKKLKFWRKICIIFSNFEFIEMLCSPTMLLGVRRHGPAPYLRKNENFLLSL